MWIFGDALRFDCVRETININPIGSVIIRTSLPVIISDRGLLWRAGVTHENAFLLQLAWFISLFLSFILLSIFLSFCLSVSSGLEFQTAFKSLLSVPVHNELTCHRIPTLSWLLIQSISLFQFHAKINWIIRSPTINKTDSIWSIQLD